MGNVFPDWLGESGVSVAATATLTIRDVLGHHVTVDTYADGSLVFWRDDSDPIEFSGDDVRTLLRFLRNGSTGPPAAVSDGSVTPIAPHPSNVRQAPEGGGWFADFINRSGRTVTYQYQTRGQARHGSAADRIGDDSGRVS
jgi:hypothetical protein